MKKQILILVLFVMAALAGVNKSYGQCLDDALHPMAGKLYHYVISAAGGGGTPTYQWIVTTSPNIVATSTFASDLGTGYTIANATTADASITWNPATIASAIAGTAYYVSVRYTATNSEGCVIDNVKSYKINPVNMFQIDLTNVKSDASTLASNNVCTSPVVTATITPATFPAIPTITYDYGTSTMYVKVTAKNFSGSWDMTVVNTLLASIGTGETGSLSWSRTIGSAPTAVVPGTAITIPQIDADPTNSEDIFLTLLVDHNTWEGLGAEAFAFTINGKDQTGLDDVSSTCTADADVVTQTIIERPTITDGTDLGPFIMP